MATPPGLPASTLTAVHKDVDVTTDRTVTLKSADMNTLADKSQYLADKTINGRSMKPEHPGKW